MKHILIIEPYFGDSHRRLIEGMTKYLPIDFTVITMQPRKWKWRMRGAAMYIVEQLPQKGRPFDSLFCSAFLSLTDLIALGPKWLRDIPKIVYFHENQLVYPVRLEKEWDFHFGLTNITTALAADKVIFNSEFNRKSFLGAIPKLLRKFPDYRPSGVAERIKVKSRVLPPPLDNVEFSNLSNIKKSGPLTIVWNHRWEFDKQPQVFFETLQTIKDRDYPFRLMVLGEKFKEYPAVFDRARAIFSDSIEHWGYVPDKSLYINQLAQADVIVSTAEHEFFGISVLEAVAAGCCPILPNRLAYPDIFPKEYLYDDDSELVNKLIWCSENINWIRSHDFSKLAEPYFWPNWQEQYEFLF